MPPDSDTSPTELRKALLSAVHDFVKETGISDSRLGILAVNNSKAIWRLKRGGDVTLKTAEAIYKTMAIERRKIARKQQAGVHA